MRIALPSLLFFARKLTTTLFYFLPPPPPHLHVLLLIVAISRYFANDKVLTDALYGLTDIRGLENAEQQGEIEGLAKASGLPLKFVQGIQML